MLPADVDQAWQVQMWDRFYDHYVHHPMQKVVGDNLRPADKRDPFGVAQAKTQIDKAFDLAEAAMQSRTWAAGEDFSLADCAAALGVRCDMAFDFARAKLSVVTYRQTARILGHKKSIFCQYIFKFRARARARYVDYRPPEAGGGLENILAPPSLRA